MVPWSDLFAALFTHVPPPTLRDGWTAKEIVDRTRLRGPVTLSEPYLSVMRAGRTAEPRLAAVAALANAFEIDIAFFTHAFHREHARLPLGDRVHLAHYRASQTDWETTALAMLELPPDQQRAVAALIDILSTQDAGVPPPPTLRGPHNLGRKDIDQGIKTPFLTTLKRLE